MNFSVDLAVSQLYLLTREAVKAWVEDDVERNQCFVLSAFSGKGKFCIMAATET